MLKAKSISSKLPSHDLLVMVSEDSFKSQVRDGLFNNHELGLLMHENKRMIYETPYTSSENWREYANMQEAVSGWVNIIACKYPNASQEMLKKLLLFRTVAGIYDFHFNDREIAACREKYSYEYPRKWFDEQADMYFKEIKKRIDTYLSTNSYDEHREDRVCFNIFPKERRFEFIYMNGKDYKPEDMSKLKMCISTVMGIPNAGEYLVYDGSSHRGLLTDTLIW